MPAATSLESMFLFHNFQQLFQISFTCRRGGIGTRVLEGYGGGHAGSNYDLWLIWSMTATARKTASIHLQHLIKTIKVR